MNMSTLLSFTNRMEGAYEAMCHPLLCEFEISKTSFDILMFLSNNPDRYTAKEISQKYQSQCGFSPRRQAGEGRLFTASERGGGPKKNPPDLHGEGPANYRSGTQDAERFFRLP